MEAVEVPLLLLHGTADVVTDPEGSRQLYARAASKDKTLRLYEGLYHDLLHEPEWQRVVADALAWIDARVEASATKG
jgi:alpha-beta hydrolase superfamily lysophospholipase